MDDKKYQIFVSSTYKDLIDAREAVIKTVLSLYQIPIGMEMFSADNDEQWEVIKSTIDYSDYYIVIIGHRYGIETFEGISYTEKEYDYAISQGIPVLAFIRDRDVSTKPNERDTDPSATQKLFNFITKATSNRMCAYWTNPDDLATCVALALSKIFHGKPRTGWVRGDKAMSSAVSEELASLSKENRELKDALKELESHITGNVPNIGVSINDGKNEVKLVPFDKSKYMLPAPQKLSLGDIKEELQPYITPDEIDTYNRSLPSEDDINKYNNKVIAYYRAKETGVKYNLQSIILAHLKQMTSI